MKSGNGELRKENTEKLLKATFQCFPESGMEETNTTDGCTNKDKDLPEAGENVP